ncbi:MAG: histidine ammonia-lyase [Roseiflexaceae bacterium]
MRISGQNLSIYDVYRIAVERERVELDQGQLAMVQSSFEKIQAWGLAKHPIYGVNTGFGELVSTIIPPQFKTELQRNLLRSHAAGGGPLFSDEVVRAIMTARLNCLMKGYSGVSPQALQMFQTFLNNGIHPTIPQQGSLGASGDLAPLSHMALPLIGEGYVRVDGQIRPSGEILEQLGLRPLELGFKEALAMINGTSAMTGAACLALVKAQQLLKQEVLASAGLIECLGGSTRAFDVRGHALKNHAGQVAVARTLTELLADSSLTHDHAALMQEITSKSAHTDDVVNTGVFLQNAYTLRCVPQILGPVVDTLNYSRRLVEEELNSCNDNPLIFETVEDTFHGGNFHGQYVAMACDFLNIALTEIGVLAERQLNRLLDPHLNGALPEFLAYGKSGLLCGFEGAQYLATSVASENLDLAAPASVKTIPSNGQNQDVVSMGLIAARKSLQLTENVQTIVASLVAGCHQASYFIGAEKFSPPLQQVNAALGQLVTQYRDDTPVAEWVERVRTHLASPQGWELVDTCVPGDFWQH